MIQTYVPEFRSVVYILLRDEVGEVLVVLVDTVKKSQLLDFKSWFEFDNNALTIYAMF